MIPRSEAQDRPPRGRRRRRNPPPATAWRSAGSAENIVGYKLWDDDDGQEPAGPDHRRGRAGRDRCRDRVGPVRRLFRQEAAGPARPSCRCRPTLQRCRSNIPWLLACGRATTPCKRRLEAILDKRRDDIRAILAGYGVPLVDKPAFAATAANGTRPGGNRKRSKDMRALLGLAGAALAIAMLAPPASGGRRRRQSRHRPGDLRARQLRQLPWRFAPVAAWARTCATTSPTTTKCATPC